MSYCSITAIYSNLPQIPNTATANGYVRATEVLNTHIRRVDGIIDGKCARRYTLPFNPVPPMIRTIAEDMVSYYALRSFYSKDGQNKNEYLADFKDEAIVMLNMIMTGDIDLVDTNGSAVPVLTEEIMDRVSSNTQDYQPFFDIDDSTSWKFDEDLMDSVRDARS
jgi:phage gp36-like protein